MRQFISAATVAMATLLGAHQALAEGNLASLPDAIELAIDTRTLTFSTTEYQLETGKYYIWSISSDGYEELMVQAPDLFRNSWINQIIIDDIEVHTSGAIYGLEFDEAGELSISFVPIRPGNYDFYSPGYAERGLKGKFVVR